jgi:AP-2 complex subunit mu-1
MKKFPGDASFILKAEVKCSAAMQEKAWARPPITMEFQVPMFTASGLHVRFLKVFEHSNYQTIKWVRYITRAGQYQIRI